MLSGSELESAEQWLARGSKRGPEPTELQKAYVLASRLRATRRQRHLLGGVTIALVVALVLGGLALLQRNNAVSQSHLSQSEDMAAEATNLFSTDVPLAMLVSLQAYERSPVLQARDALVQAAEQPLDATLSEGNPVDRVAFSPNGQTLAVGDSGGYVGLWDMASRKRAVTFLYEGNEVNSVAFSPNGQTLAVGDSGGDVGLWNTATGKRTASLSENKGSAVYSVAFSPNGHTLAVGDNDGEVGLWDTANGKQTAILSEGNQVNCVAFGPNGQTLAVGDATVTSGFGTRPVGGGPAPCPRGAQSSASPSSRTAGPSPWATTAVTSACGTRPAGSEISTLSEGSAVESVAFSPNGHDPGRWRRRR